MKHILIYNLFLSSVLLSFSLNAQVDTVSRLKPIGKSIIKKEEGTGMVLKSSIFRLGRGELTFLAEYQNNKKWSIEFGPSLTYYDFGWDYWFQNGLLHDQKVVPQSTINPMSWKNARLGAGFTASFKWFFEYDGLLNGRGISLFLNQRLHRYKQDQVVDGKDMANVFVSELALMYFSQDIFGPFREFNIGLGMNQHSMQIQRYTSNGVTDYFIWDSFNYIKPAVYFNIKWGLELFRK
ncbi:MAG: hypothetical protein GC180_03035 [Bacteroidetes bacterium]|nr:hypothetical protein [Bacteroidota bacterium]